MPRVSSGDRIYDPTGNYYRVPEWVFEKAGRKPEILWLPSVSTILDVYQAPTLRTWYGKMGLEEAERIKNQTASQGTYTHAIIERIIKGGKVEAEEWNGLPEQTRQCIRAWLRWYQTAEFKPERAEQPVFSLRYGYAGTLDATGYTGNKLYTLADWKTTNGAFFPRTNLLQLGAYFNAYHELYPERPRFKSVRCVSLNRQTGNFDEHHLTAKQARDAFRVFIKAKGVWDFIRKEYYEQERNAALNVA